MAVGTRGEAVGDGWDDESVGAASVGALSVQVVRLESDDRRRQMAGQSARTASFVPSAAPRGALRPRPPG
jgi:hypothetical protein